jgi:hypothetical protein
MLRRERGGATRIDHSRRAALVSFSHRSLPGPRNGVVLPGTSTGGTRSTTKGDVPVSTPLLVRRRHVDLARVCGCVCPGSR